MRNVKKNVIVQDLRFPGRQDYLTYFNLENNNSSNISHLDDTKIHYIQRNWHCLGQNGCLFAMKAAKTLTHQQWSTTVHHTLPSAKTLQNILHESIEKPSNSLHSFIFPFITNCDQLDSLLTRFRKGGCYLEKEDHDTAEIIKMRYFLGNVESWVIGFAPIEALPITRQAPFCELIFRTKTKTKIIHQDLNNNNNQAHVADLDLGLSLRVVGKLIQKSKDHTAYLLGGYSKREKDFVAKAKNTFGIYKDKKN